MSSAGIADDQMTLYTNADSTDLVLFEKGISFRENKRKMKTERVWTFEHDAATCNDHMAPWLLKSYANLLEETAKWHVKWDDDERRQSHADAGEQRYELGKSSDPGSSKTDLQFMSRSPSQR